MKSQILQKELLAPAVCRIVLAAPRIASHARAGQFVILRAVENGERIPLTIADYDRSAGTVTLIYQIVGGTTMQLYSLKAGDFLPDLAGPLGRPSELEGLRRVAVVGGGVGCAIAAPVAKALHEQGADVTMIAGFRNREMVILENEMAAVSRLWLMTDDGSAGEKGFVTAALEDILSCGEKFDRVFAIGPLAMMQAVADLTLRYDTPCTVSMNPIMIDGTGMCGCCRLTVGGEVKFACVDGPEFDGHLVDFAEAIRRSRLYQTEEAKAREANCHLLEGVEHE